MEMAQKRSLLIFVFAMIFIVSATAHALAWAYAGGGSGWPAKELIFACFLMAVAGCVALFDRALR